MKITSQEEYGVRCLLRLARVHGEQSLTIPEIAAAENLSAPYVGKLLAVLRQAGLIESVRGRTGGYHLTRPPEEIRLGGVLLALGEPLFDEPGYCVKHAGPETVGDVRPPRRLRLARIVADVGTVDAARPRSGDVRGPAAQDGVVPREPAGAAARGRDAPVDAVAPLIT